MPSPDDVNLAVSVDKDLYFHATATFQHGQLSAVIRKFLVAIGRLKDEDRLNELFDWLYSGKDLLITKEED